MNIALTLGLKKSRANRHVCACASTNVRWRAASYAHIGTSVLVCTPLRFVSRILSKIPQLYGKCVVRASEKRDTSVEIRICLRWREHERAWTTYSRTIDERSMKDRAALGTTRLQLLTSRRTRRHAKSRAVSGKIRVRTRDGLRRLLGSSRVARNIPKCKG